MEMTISWEMLEMFKEEFAAARANEVAMNAVTGNGIKEAGKWFSCVESLLNSRALKQLMLVANRYEGWVSDHLKIPTVLRMLVLTGSYIWKIPEPCKTFISIPFSTATL